MGVAGSVFIFLLVLSWEQAHQRSEFESLAMAYTNAVENTLNEYVGALLFLGDFFNNSLPVTRQQFNSFVKSVLPRYPGIQALGWDPLVKDNERAAYESLARKEGFDDFQFTERSETNEIVRAARRKEYVIVYYIHPLKGNRRAFGFDIASNKTRLKAITKAFATAQLSITGRITLVQETGNQFGALLLLPIYHQRVTGTNLEEHQDNRRGFVVEVLRIGQVVETAMNGFSDVGISLTLYDMSADEDNRFLYHRPTRMLKPTDHQIPTADNPKGLFFSKIIDIAERKWKILVSPSDAYFHALGHWQAWLVLIVSLLLTTLTAVYMLRKIFYTTEIEHRIKMQMQTNQLLENEIRDRKQKQEALRESEEKYRTVLEATPDPVVVYNMEGKVIYFNQAFTNVFGWPLEERLGKKMDLFVPEKAWTETRMMIGKVLSGEGFSGVETHRYNHRKQIIPVSISGAIYKGKNDNPIGSIITLRDTSDKKRMESQLQQSQKMEAIGTLAGGIAHDFNNILAGILGYSELLLADLPSDASVRNKVEAIHSSGERARDLVSQILAYSRKDEQVRSPIEMHLVIKDALKLLRPAIPATIDIQTQISSDCQILGDPSRVHQIIMNLCTNAFQSMLESGGTLKIKLSRIEVVDKAVGASVPAGTYGILTISDTGVGIPAENLERIFDPYFTTKEKGKGTGLGLAAVHGIVKSHGGTILVESHTGIGTSFEVYLPLALERSDTGVQFDSQIIGGQERILVVDDEHDILEIEKEALKRLGYMVTAKDNAHEALKLFTSQPDQFDLVITDMTMPNMAGDKLADELLKIRSDLPVILCTGYSELISKEKAAALGIKGFLMKPISVKDLANMIRNVLDDKNTSIDA